MALGFEVFLKSVLIFTTIDLSDTPDMVQYQ